MDEMRKAIATALKDCMALKQGEEFLSIGDEPSREIATAFWEVAKEMNAESIYAEIIPRSSHGEEPPPALAAMMARAKCIVAPTSRSLSHTEARKKACEAGARVATLPGITKDILIRGLSADYKTIAQRTVQIRDILTEGKIAHIQSDKGTDLRLSLEGMAGHADTGIIHDPGNFSNLPAGEAFIAPTAGRAEGILVVDGSMAGIGMVEKTITLTIEKGEAVKIEGSRELEKIMEKYGRKARNIAELGVGTNDRARLSGNVLEDEKVLGTVHVAVGDNSTFGGSVSVPVHLDGIIRNPVLTVDGKIVVKDGKLQI
ncbi:aminopeptidase [candidate division TA06 bacterium]|uniref:Aminopeptidase n=1 Tax=candidate division TA06 bacterium TaxID=2250710 RepID=A0A523USW8_UNCT6|nr:MAG: aminopeptidase [candidate division TA06 bacterium]